ncbi:hypothetical protein [Chryseobacterium arthrosphaerae]|uniref:hypothetical protein n=1 Tax=Chryseobacterium arthrosphaerae TaxID=651561 RepID=UPI003D3307D0
MLLKGFKIYNGITGREIRKIKFNKKGLSLIIDNTPANVIDSKSGNNVGKTTFLRSIDFCLGSDGKNLFQDKETKNDNVEVKDFLHNNKVIFELELLRNDGSIIKLQRSLVNEFDFFIDNIKQSNLKTYNLELNKIFFGISDTGKLSFRNLIKKFVRADEFSESNLIRTQGHYKNDNDYEAIYLFLLGFPNVSLVSERLQVSNELKRINKELKNLKYKSELPKLEIRLFQIEESISVTENNISNYNLEETYTELLKKLNDVKDTSVKINNEIANLDMKISLSIKSKEELLSSKKNIDPRAIENLYNEAKILIPNLQKKFEEVLAFHNSMVENKIEYINNHLAKLTQRKESLIKEVSPLLKEQSHILRLLDKKGSFDDLIAIREELNLLFEDKGKIEFEIDRINNLLDLKSQLEERYETISSEFSIFLHSFNENIQNIFNKYFKDFTLKTHGEQIYLFYNDQTGKFDFDNIKGNVGDGYKKTDIIAFDLSFINYYYQLGFDYPRFSIHDKIEIIHKNQLKILFDITEDIEGQFIVSILRDRISFLGDKFIKDKGILELSQDDKFFRF